MTSEIAGWMSGRQQNGNKYRGKLREAALTISSRSAPEPTRHQRVANPMSFSQCKRATLMRNAAQVLRSKAGEYAHLMAQEMGKPVRDGVAEAEKCATGCDFYAENAARFLAREPIATEAHKSFVTFNPLGVVLAVMPWNFPFWQVFRFAAPGLAPTILPPC
jgi:acyl-CoA reductase-like NAD-dependent aldehyde dehydrogenase